MTFTDTLKSQSAVMVWTFNNFLLPDSLWGSIVVNMDQRDLIQLPDDCWRVQSESESSQPNTPHQIIQT